MRFLYMALGGLLGAVPGFVLFALGGENLGMIFGGFVLGVFGLIIGAAVGWKRSSPSSGEGDQGPPPPADDASETSGWRWRVGGAVIGLAPGLVLWWADWPVNIVVLFLIAGSIFGGLVGNRLGRL